MLNLFIAHRKFSKSIAKVNSSFPAPKNWQKVWDRIDAYNKRNNLPHNYLQDVPELKKNWNLKITGEK
jgi:hypothetical protein